jgi:hypothetical protein
MTDYQKAKIYRLVATGTTDCYIGSTCKSLANRLCGHRHAAANPESQLQSASCKLYNEGKTVTIELIEEFPCNSKAELAARERYWIENTPTAINTNIPGQDWKERRQRRQADHDAYMKAFRTERYICECGKEIGRAERARHERSKKHTDWKTAG